MLYWKAREDSGMDTSAIWTGNDCNYWVHAHKDDFPEMPAQKIWDEVFEMADLDDLVRAISEDSSWDPEKLEILCSEAGLDPDDYDDVDEMASACEEALGIVL